MEIHGNLWTFYQNISQMDDILINSRGTPPGSPFAWTSPPHSAALCAAARHKPAKLGSGHFTAEKKRERDIYIYIIFIYIYTKHYKRERFEAQKMCG